MEHFDKTNYVCAGIIFCNKIIKNKINKIDFMCRGSSFVPCTSGGVVIHILRGFYKILNILA